MPPNLLSLATELKEEIATYLPTSTGDDDTHSQLDALASYRLACKNLEESCFQYFARTFFSSVTVCIQDEDLRKLVEFSKCSRLAVFVQKVVVIGQFTTSYHKSRAGSRRRQLLACLFAEQELMIYSGVAVSSLASALSNFTKCTSIKIQHGLPNHRTTNRFLRSDWIERIGRSAVSKLGRRPLSGRGRR